MRQNELEQRQMEAAKILAAVNAVIALMAYTPFIVIVFMSAWIPAPPQESLPAIDNAVLISYSPFDLICIIFIERRKVVPPIRRLYDVNCLYLFFNQHLHFLFILLRCHFNIFRGKYSWYQGNAVYAAASQHFHIFKVKSANSNCRNRYTGTDFF